MKSPLVAIWMLTYNHENFISKAVESVVMQQTNFEFKLYIGEDFSTDKTRQICIELAKKYPDKIALLLNDKNDIVKNADRVYKACLNSEAKYLSLMDGDDYWTDNLKLQKQIDFLEANSEYSMCFTNHITINQDGNIISEDSVTSEFAREVNHYDVLSNNYYIGTASVVIRKNCLPIPLPDKFLKAPNGDYFLYSLATRHGNAAYLNFSASAYRVHDTGIWTRRSSAQKYWAMYQTFLVTKNIFTTAKEQEALVQNLKKILQHLSWAYLEQPRVDRMQFILKSFFISLRFGVISSWFKTNSDVLNLFIKNKLKLKSA